MSSTTGRTAPKGGERGLSWRRSRPAGMRDVDAGRQDLARLRLQQLVDPVRTEPLRHHHEERPAVLAAQHARVAWAVQLDPIQHLAALADAKDHTALLGPDVAAPHGALGVQADPIARDAGPH